MTLSLSKNKSIVFYTEIKHFTIQLNLTTRAYCYIKVHRIKNTDAQNRLKAAGSQYNETYNASLIKPTSIRLSKQYYIIPDLCVLQLSTSSKHFLHMLCEHGSMRGSAYSSKHTGQVSSSSITSKLKSMWITSTNTAKQVITQDPLQCFKCMLCNVYTT